MIEDEIQLSCSITGFTFITFLIAYLQPLLQWQQVRHLCLPRQFLPGHWQDRNRHHFLGKHFLSDSDQPPLEAEVEAVGSKFVWPVWNWHKYLPG